MVVKILLSWSVSMIFQATTENRFWVTKNAEAIIELHGTIKDTTPFTSIDEMLTDTNIFDLSGLTTASWMGLRHLHDHIYSFNKPSIMNFPSSRIYEKIKLFGNLFEKYDLDNIGMLFVDSKGSIVEKSVRISQLIDHVKSNGDYGFSLDGARLIGPVSFQIPRMNLERMQIKIGRSTGRKNEKYVYFWESYLNFLYLTVNQCQTQINDIQIGLAGEVQNIGSLLHKFEKGLTTLIPSFDSNRSHKIPAMLETFTNWNLSLIDGIQKVTESVLGLCADFSDSIDCPDSDSHQIMIDLQKSLVNIMKPMEEVIQHIEVYGKNIGEALFSFVNVKQIKSEFDSFDDKNMSADLLERVRDQFEIMDIMSEDSWEETKSIIVEDIEAIKGYRKSCCVILQGFDLCRQVLEHRIEEAKIISHCIGDSSRIKLEVLDMITSKMVTEQEKFCCRFFYPVEYSHSMKSGEGLGQSSLVFL